jgi:alpha-tubulin suppressor-like RCC1 family protein
MLNLVKLSAWLVALVLVGLLLNSCGSSGGGSGSSGSVPMASQLMVDPILAIQGEGNGQIQVNITFSISDDGGDVSTVSIGLYDPQGSQLMLSSEPLQDASGITSGIISGTLFMDTTIAPGTYSIHIYVTDADGSKSNELTQDFTVLAPLPPMVATGWDHACFRSSPFGDAKCWGTNWWGEVGNGTYTSFVDAPSPVIDLTKAVSIASGHSHSCAALTNGYVKCWGSNLSGQLGAPGYVNDSSLPFSAPIYNAKRVTAGKFHSCAVLSDGSVSCWGSNVFGQASNPGTDNAVDVAAGDMHTCAVLADGTVSCWGYNGFGQLGNSSTTNSGSPVKVNGITNAAGIASGANHSCALLADHTVKCWGRNGSGELGNGTGQDSSIPVTAVGINSATALWAGGANSCVLLSSGDLKCWGNNSYGQVGNGTTIDALVPQAVSGLSNVQSMSLGEGYACAASDYAGVKCWGAAPQFTDHSTVQQSYVPRAVNGLSGVEVVRAGLLHSCAILADGTTKCWGSNYFGDLGNPIAKDSDIPVTVSTGGTATALDAGNNGGPTCIVLSDGTVDCWGLSLDRPVKVSGITNAVDVKVGKEQACALLSDGTVLCWKYLGNSESGRFDAPSAVAGLSNVVALTVGDAHACALMSDRTVKCWGSNMEGQIGSVSCPDSYCTPTTVPNVNNVTSVAAAGIHTCASFSDGTISCWGWNLPQTIVSGIASAVAVDTAPDYSCALLADHTVKCWGINVNGELGVGSTPDYASTPLQVSGIDTAIAITTGNTHACAQLSDQTVQCWGQWGDPLAFNAAQLANYLITGYSLTPQ